MKRTGRTLVILTVAFWLAALAPPALAGRDPVRIGVGVGGEVVDLVNPADHDEGDDEGDDEGGDNDEDNGDGLLDGLVALLVGNGDEDEDEDEGDGLVTQVVEVLFGEENDAVDPAPVVSAGVAPAAAPHPADDDDEGVVGEVLDLLEDDLLEDTVEFVLVEVGDNQVVATVCQVRHGLHNGLTIIKVALIGPVGLPPIGGPTPPMCVP